jgi:demethylmenaquinone methyltransferase/2-methoxy-6-polyprenyl-1,4-benzoquinol methylase
MKYDVERILPDGADEAPKRQQVARMFDDIAPSYDSLNHLLSFGIDRYWRRKGILTLRPLMPQTVLDIATGTGDLALEAYRLLQPESVLGIDISEKMMDVAREKVAGIGLSNRITFEQQDCSALRAPDNSFDAAIVAFGVRNFEDLDKSLQEILRVLRPKGRLMILELSTPERFPFKQAYRLYSRLIPFVGQRIARNRAAYRYLPRSIAAFPQGAAMQQIMTRNGFQNASFRRFTLGICTMYLGDKA